MALNLSTRWSRATPTTGLRASEGEAREGAMTVSLINDPSDFVPSPPKKLGEWAKWFEGGELLTSLVSECIDYSVDFEVVKETARERADRVWGMEEPKNGKSQ
jgi:hypothetical protein